MPEGGIARDVRAVNLIPVQNVSQSTRPEGENTFLNGTLDFHPGGTLNRFDPRTPTDQSGSRPSRSILKRYDTTRETSDTAKHCA